MPYGMYLSAAGANAQSKRLEVLTHNLANVDTPGFKRELAVLQARHSEAIERGDVPPGTGGIDDIGGGIALDETITHFEPGSLKQTNLDTDLAIEDEKTFFMVQREGQQLLTRAGNFRFASDGRLLTQQGDSVLNAGGDPVVLNPTLPWSVIEGGIIQQADQQIPLALVQPRSLGDLARVGENYFSPLAPPAPAPATERNVAQGFLEQSGVRPALEMMELIEASRAYEANVRMIQNQDTMIGSLVNRLLKQA